MIKQREITLSSLKFSGDLPELIEYAGAGIIGQPFVELHEVTYSQLTKKGLCEYVSCRVCTYTLENEIKRDQRVYIISPESLPQLPLVQKLHYLAPNGHSWLQDYVPKNTQLKVWRKELRRVLDQVIFPPRARLEILRDYLDRGLYYGDSGRPRRAPND